MIAEDIDYHDTVRPWTSFEISDLRTAWEDARPIAIVATKLQRSQDAVKLKASRMGLKRGVKPACKLRDFGYRAKVRNCLCCGSTFVSQHNGIRKCDPCRGSLNDGIEFFTSYH